MESNFPLVSIITPTFNHENYILDCIRSVQNQTYPHWEMLIINDGSTDSTADIALNFAANDQRIKIINQENIGVFRLGETYNKALNLAKGEYIAILEGDDMWIEEKLERQVSALEGNDNLTLAWSSAYMINEDDTQIYKTVPPLTSDISLYQNIPRGSVLCLFARGIFIPAVTIFIRKSALIKIGGFVQAAQLPLIDFTTLMTLAVNNDFYFDDSVLGKWRMYSTQTTKKYTIEIFEGIQRFTQKLLPQFSQLSKHQKKSIILYLNKLRLSAYARSGRYKLIRKDYQGARKDYIKAIFFPSTDGWIWRLRSAVGFGLSLFHLDVEWLAGLLGKKTYKG